MSRWMGRSIKVILNRVCLLDENRGFTVKDLESGA